MDCEKVSNHIIKWLTDYATRNRMHGFVVGVSGGVDSALVSTLCAKTGLPTLVVEMPIHRPVSNIVERSSAHVAWLKDKYWNTSSELKDLSKVYDAQEEVYPGMSDLAKANTRSRIRMTTLYSFANTIGLLVAGTGNKVEDYGVAFFTKFGDGGVDISPIGGLLKSQVRALSKHLGIIDDIVNAVPTDELWADTRSDEQQIGASYDNLEFAMNFCKNRGIETNADLSTFISTGAPAYFDLPKILMDTLEIYIKRHEAGAHKMNPPPVCEIPEEWLMAA